MTSSNISLFPINLWTSPRRKFQPAFLPTNYITTQLLTYDPLHSVEETNPRKRIFLKYRLPSDNNYEPLLPIFQYFLRMTDQLVQVAHFRPEVLRKVKSVRDEMIKGIQKANEQEKAEELAIEREKQRKAKRDAELAAMDAKAQKKYLEKEREREAKRQTKKMTTRA